MHRTLLTLALLPLAAPAWSARPVGVGRCERPTRTPTREVGPTSCDWLADPAYEVPCPGAPTVDPPLPPGPTSPPLGATPVDSTASLVAAVADPSVTDILLLPGDYSCTPELHGTGLILQSQHLWSQPGDAVLGFGIRLTRTGGGLHGLDFAPEGTACIPHLYNQADDVHGGLVLVESVPYPYVASDVTLEDLTLDGSFIVSSGIRAGASSGLAIHRVDVREILNWGVRVDPISPDKYAAAGGDPTYKLAAMTDLQVSHVANPEEKYLPCFFGEGSPVPNYFPGRGEHGLFIGTTSRVVRVRLRDIAGVGITVASGKEALDPENHYPNRSTFQHIDIDRVGPSIPLGNPHLGGSAIALERVVEDLSIRNLCVGPQTGRGVHLEYHQACPVDGDGLCITSYHPWHARNITVTDALIDSKASANHVYDDCDPGETGAEAWEVVEEEGLRSAGIVVGAHSEGLHVEDTMIRFSTCSAMRLENLNDDFDENGLQGCEVAPFGPPADPFVLVPPGPELGCSDVPSSFWYTPWCPTLVNVSYVDIPGDCAVADWKGFQCTNSFPGPADGCLLDP